MTIDAHNTLLKSGPMYQLALWIGLFDILVTAPACQAMGEGERELILTFSGNPDIQKDSKDIVIFCWSINT